MFMRFEVICQIVSVYRHSVIHIWCSVTIFGFKKTQKNVQWLNLRFHLRIRVLKQNGKTKDHRRERKRGAEPKIKCKKSCDSLSNPLTFIQFVFHRFEHVIFFPFTITIERTKTKEKSMYRTCELVPCAKMTIRSVHRMGKRKGTLSNVRNKAV